jgi:hypothetical protein
MIPGPALEERVASVVAHLDDVTFSRHVFRSGPLATMTDEELIRHLVPHLRTILLS